MNKDKITKIVVIDSGISEHKNIIGEINGVDIISSGEKYEVIPTKKIDNIGRCKYKFRGHMLFFINKIKKMLRKINK